MTRKLAFLVTAFAILASTNPAEAQQAGKIYRIGFLTSGSAPPFKSRLAAFRQGLQELGYLEGKNLLIEERYAAGRRERLPALAKELVRLKVDVIVTHGGRIALVGDRAAKELGSTIPIVFAVDLDPVGSGVVASLARPGGNITGLSSMYSELNAKRLGLLKEVLPSASRIAVFWHPRWSHTARQLKALQVLAPALGVTLLPLKFKELGDFDRASDAIRKESPDALMPLGYSLISTYRRQIAEFAIKSRLPTMGPRKRMADAGLLMAYGPELPDLYRRAATYVDKILKGAKPAEMPVEQPTRFYLTVNLKTAKALGITFPRSILLRADKVIE